jgi:hypothetical protein
MWKQIDQYHLRNEGWTISKMKLANGTKYALWNNKENHGFFDSAEEAKQWYEELTK